MKPVTVGVIGLGNMGSRMARQLLAHNRAVIGYDRDLAAAARAGVVAAPSVEAVGERAAVVLLSLPNSSVVEKVVLGPGGLQQALRPGAVVADLSTSSPSSTRHIHEALKANHVDYIDAGVSGGPAAAEKGALTLMVGGEQTAIDRLEPILNNIATKVFRMGGSGTGHTAKLLNNFLNAVNLSASAEVLLAGARGGLDVAKLLDAINASSGANWATQNRFPSILRGDYLEGGLTSVLMMKDLLLYVEYLAEVGVPSLHASGPMAAFGVALQTGRGDVVSNRVVDALGDLAGGARVASLSHHDGKDLP